MKMCAYCGRGICVHIWGRRVRVYASTCMYACECVCLQKCMCECVRINMRKSAFLFSSKMFFFLSLFFNECQHCIINHLQAGKTRDLQKKEDVPNGQLTIISSGMVERTEKQERKNDRGESISYKCV
jgi:hypothetical protein